LSTNAGHAETALDRSNQVQNDAEASPLVSDIPSPRPNALSEKDYVQSGCRRFDISRDRWMHEDSSVRRFVEPPFFTTYSSGNWNQTANNKRAVVKPSGVYGKTTNELLPAMLYPGESKANPFVVRPTERPYEKIALDHYNRGVEFHQEGLLDQAKLEYEAATRSDNRMAEAWANLGGIYMVQKNYSEAVEVFDKVLRLQPSYTRVSPSRSFALKKLKGRH
jgi:tetratricopeptide (TPR) repeat protein